MDTIESLRRKIDGAEDLKSVVRTMKAVSAANIGQYEVAVSSLGDYYRTVALGILAHFGAQEMGLKSIHEKPKVDHEKLICAIVFGSDQGLVGQFNDSLAGFVFESLNILPGKKEIWAVGERVQLLLADVGFTSSKLFPVPNSVNAITTLVGDILVQSQGSIETGALNEFYIYYNQSKVPTGYESVMKQLLPPDEKWEKSLDQFYWPTKKIPQIAGGIMPTLKALIREYLFVSLFKACAESLASENESRLSAMERANKNIDELLQELGLKYHQKRQNSIDAELFDVVAGFEAMNDGTL